MEKAHTIERQGLRFGVLDQVPVHGGADAAQAVNDAVELARLSDRLGFSRYWMAEHHGMPFYACSSPALLLSRIGAETQHIRLGSAGVLLPHYSPYKVAEDFRVLDAMYPGRMDLGIGRAPGGDHACSQALHWPGRADAEWEQQAAFLAMCLDNDTMRERPPLPGLTIYPDNTQPPQLWMLGGSGSSAELAGRLGYAYALALFIGSSHPPADILRIYRDSFRVHHPDKTPRTVIGLGVYCAETDREAEAMASTQAFRKVQSRFRGERTPLRSPEDIAATTLTSDERAYFHGLLDAYIVGSPDTCTQKINDLASTYEPDEAVMVNVSYYKAARFHSYELLAEHVLGPTLQQA